MEDKELRQEFARLFGWYDFDKSYGYSEPKKTLREPTWAEIYCEIGRLLALKAQKDFSERFNQLDQMVNELHDKFYSKNTLS